MSFPGQYKTDDWNYVQPSCISGPGNNGADPQIFIQESRVVYGKIFLKRSLYFQLLNSYKLFVSYVDFFFFCNNFNGQLKTIEILSFYEEIDRFLWSISRIISKITICNIPKSLFQRGCVLLKLATNNQTVLRLATIFAEGIFNGETLVVSPPNHRVNSKLAVQLIPPKETPLDVHIKVSRSF